MSKKIYITIVILFCAAGVSVAQNFSKAQWSRVTMDATWDPVLDAAGRPVNGSKTHDIIAKYKPTVDSLMVVIGYASKELDKYAPESPLSNLAADILLATGDDYLQRVAQKESIEDISKSDARKEKNIKKKTRNNKKKIEEKDRTPQIDFALTNFGGIRTSLPAGDITPYDIISIFPFDNKLVILDMEGKQVRELMENFAKRGRVEALSGVKVVIDKNVLTECLIAGEPIDDNRIYKLATIDFLLGGGDNVYALKYNSGVVNTGIMIRDAVISYIQDLTARGKEVDASTDGRVVIIKAPKDQK